MVLDELAQRLLAKSPEDRPESGQVVADILLQVIESQSGLAKGQTLLIPHGETGTSSSSTQVAAANRLNQLIDQAGRAASRPASRESMAVRLRKRFPLVENWPILAGMLLMLACFAIGGVWGWRNHEFAHLAAVAGGDETATASDVTFHKRDSSRASRAGGVGDDRAPSGEGAAAVHLPSEITNQVGMRLLYLPPGEFEMGSADEHLDRILEIDPELKREWFDDEQPRRIISITEGLYMGESEVTQRQWTQVMNTQPWTDLHNVEIGPDYPAVGITWNEANEFCKKLSAWARREYRLPTEAEWEYACRAGTSTLYSFGDDHTLLNDHAWWGALSLTGGSIQDGPHAREVAKKNPNPYGFYDMHGNIFEWCNDWYDENAYKEAPDDDPKGPEKGQFRVYRGGAWDCTDLECRSADRHRSDPSHRAPNIGFRVVMKAPNR